MYKRRLNAIFKEATNTNNIYCVNLKLTSQFKIIFEIYSEENPINLYFKTKLDIKELNTLHSYFNSFKNINDIYEAINDIMRNGNYGIIFNDSQNKKIVLILFINKEQIKIDLNRENISIEQNDLELNEFINDFYQEFLNLKLILNYQFNQKNDEIKKINEENKDIKNKLDKIIKENDKLKTKITNLKKKIGEIKVNNGIERKTSKNYPKKEELINNTKKVINRDNDSYIHQQNVNNNQIYNFISPQTYLNNNIFNYYNDYLAYINKNNDNVK